jgi:hypothetical protein
MITKKVLQEPDPYVLGPISKKEMQEIADHIAEYKKKRKAKKENVKSSSGRKKVKSKA